MKMITAGKRVRAAAFTNDEKIILRDAIRPFSSIILSNKTDSSTVLRKQEAWVAIQYGYNSYANVTQRTKEQLRKAWENMKQRYKRGEFQSRNLSTDCDNPLVACDDLHTSSALSSTPLLPDTGSPAVSLLGLTVSDDEAELPRLSAQPEFKMRCHSPSDLGSVHGMSHQNALHALQLREANAGAEAAELRVALLREELSYERERHNYQLREARAMAEIAEMRAVIERRNID